MKTWCVAGKHYSGTINENNYEKLNSKTQKTLEFLKVLVVFVDETKAKFLLSKGANDMWRRIQEKAKCKSNHKSANSN